MWLGDLTVDTSTDSSGDSSQPATGDNSYVRLAANLIDMIHPYKQGVPVSVAISPQTQSFLIMGGVALGGLLLLNMIRK